MHEELILKILTGGLLGILGQGIRTIVGLKKWYDEQKANPESAEAFDTKRLFLSMFIGFVAGGLGILAYESFKGTQEEIITLLGIGYAGVDFIEGFITKYLPKANTSPPAILDPTMGEG